MSKRLYLDTSALVKLYIAESGSEWVQKKCEAADLLLMSPLQETELKNAILASAGRGIISQDSMRKTLEALKADLQNNCYLRTQPDWPLVWRRANQIAEAHTPTILSRTLDILHVAIAEATETDLMITGDERQFSLGQGIGLSMERVPA